MEKKYTTCLNGVLIRQSRMLECWNAGMHKSHLSPSANIHAKACMFLVKGLTLFVFIALAGCAANQKTIDPPMEMSETSAPVRSAESTAVTGDDDGQPLPAGVEPVTTPFGVMYQQRSATAPPLSVSPAEEVLSDRDDRVAALIEKQKRSTRTRQVKHGFDRAGLDGRRADTTGPDDAKEGDLVLNFDDADLYEVIQTIAELLTINYMIDPAVRGKVTIHTASKLSSSDLWPVFYQILEANGLTAIREDNLYRITQLKDASRLPIVSGYGRETKDIPPSERVIMQIVPLQYMDGAEMTKIVTPFLSTEGTIVSHADSNTLLIVDKGVNVYKALHLVRAFDTDLLEDIFHRFYFLTNAEANHTAELLNKVISAYDKKGSLGLSLIPIDRLNAVLAISKDERSFKKIEEYIDVFDVQSDVAQMQIYVYAVKNGEAENLASLMGNIFTQNAVAADTGEDTEAGKDTQKPQPAAQNPFLRKPANEAGDKPKTSVSGGLTGIGTLRDGVKITPDSIRNSLIIEATPQDYRIVSGILEKLDVLPRQVLIEATIAEVTLDDKTSLGVEWNYLKGEKDLGTSLISGKMGTDGLNLLIGETGRWSAALSAWAQNNNANILARPSVMASDNKKALINISTEVPVVSSTYANTGSESDIITTNVEYRNTGLILTVTPHINENGLVSMDIEQEVSEQSGDTVVAGISYPTFFKRTVNTSFVVKHNQTIIIGGLIRENKSGGKSGVPILKDIPGMGFLFGKDADTFQKTELIIFITPHVIVHLDDVDELTRDFKSKVNQSIQKVIPEKY